MTPDDMTDEQCDEIKLTDLLSLRTGLTSIMAALNEAIDAYETTGRREAIRKAGRIIDLAESGALEERTARA